MPLNKGTITLPNNLNRKQVRDYVINVFLLEQPGTGKGDDCSKYVYVAETLRKRNILLKRPAVLNKGVDFTVHVEGIRFRPKGASLDMPSHDNIFTDLDEKKRADRAVYSKIMKIIGDLYNCRDVNGQQCAQANISAGLLTTEEVVMAIKWLFIEQDVTYWNWSGRNMLFSGLRDCGLA